MMKYFCSLYLYKYIRGSIVHKKLNSLIILTIQKKELCPSFLLGTMLSSSSAHLLSHSKHRSPGLEFTCKIRGLCLVNIPNKHLFVPHHRCSFKIRGSTSFSATQVIRDVEKETFDGDQISTTMKELRDCFNSGKTRSYEWRISQMISISKMLDEKENEICAALQSDLSKPQHEAFISEINLPKESCKLAIKELKLWMKPQKVVTTISTQPSSAEIVSEPLGVVLVISTWNLPFMLSLEPVIGAIIAGNAVVLKPSEVAPATSSLLAKLLKEYTDNSAVRVIEGGVPTTTALLEQKWDKIFYTGSSRVGRIVMSAAAKHLTPVTLELGGKNPTIVDSDVNLQVAARRIVSGKWGCNNGQVCIGPDYVITTKAFAPKLIDALRSELKVFYGENPLESKDISRIVNLYHFQRLSKLMLENKVFDKIVLGGQTNEEQLKIAPTIFLDVPLDSLLMEEEIFGPLLPILTVENLRDSFSIIKSRPKPLVAYLFTNNEELKKDFVSNISSGGMLINDVILHVTVPTLPFGGVGESGMGSYHGKFSFDDFSHKKAILYREFGGESPTRYPPYSPEKLSLLKTLISGDIFKIIPALLQSAIS